MSMTAMDMDYQIDDEKEDFRIGPFGKYDSDILKRCQSLLDEKGEAFHQLYDRVETITGFADDKYVSSRLVKWGSVKPKGSTIDTVALILSANLWMHMLMDDPETTYKHMVGGLSTRYDLEELGWMLANCLGCSTETVLDMLQETTKVIHLEQYYVDKCNEIASCNGVKFEDGERLSRMIEVLIRSPVLVEPVSLYNVIQYKLMKWPGVPFVDDDRYDQILHAIKRWENNPIGISPLAYSNEVVEYKYQKLPVKGILPNGEVHSAVVFPINDDVRGRIRHLPGYDSEARMVLSIDGKEWLGVVHISYRSTDLFTGTDRGAYANHLTLFIYHGNLFDPKEGTRGKVPAWLWIDILKDMNMARCRMYQGANEGYNRTRKTEIGGEGGMWTHVFNNRGIYSKDCVATRYRVGRNETTYVRMCLDDDRETTVSVEDRGIKMVRDGQRDGLVGKNQLPRPFRTDLVKRLINGDGLTMNGDTTVNVAAKYIHSDSPMKIAHVAMAYTRIRSAIEDIADSIFDKETEILDYHRNANNFIVLLNVLLMDKPPLSLITLGDDSIIADVFNVEDKMARMGIALQ